MSNLERRPREVPCGGRAAVAVEPVREMQFGAAVALGGPRGMSVTRTLPNRARRMVGAWCFVDYYGPDDITGSAGMRVPPDRKSTRLNSSHTVISYAVFCLKKKKEFLANVTVLNCSYLLISVRWHT